jgi:hypothetical protein
MMDKAPQSRIGEMSVMNRSGHTQLKWHMDSLKETAAAEDVFNQLIGKGYSAFGSKTKAAPKHAIHEFDSTMEDVVLVPRIIGG